MKAAHSVQAAHSQKVRGIDYNPNKPYVALCGDDYYVRYWDLRKPDELLATKAHAHWATCALYNRFHDQLVLAEPTTRFAGRDADLAGTAMADADDPELTEAEADGLVKSSTTTSSPSSQPRGRQPTLDLCEFIHGRQGRHQPRAARRKV